jgi:RNA polymerase sigma-70 factor (ECF subfamily)
VTAEDYNECVERHADGLYRFILKNIKDEDEACDIVQDAYEKMWRNKGNIDATKSKTYLFTTAYHILIDNVRRGKRQTSIEQVVIKDFYQDGYSDLNEILNNALDMLPEIQKTVIMLRDYEGYAYEEIGEITGLSQSQVKVYIYRARMFLKNFICKPELVI